MENVSVHLERHAETCNAILIPGLGFKPSQQVLALM